MFFETAGIEVSFWIPPLTAFLISTFTSMGGVSGAFLILPFQVSVLGFTSPAVSATNQLYNIVAIPSGVLRYIREGRMVWPLMWIVVIGTIPGVFIGAIIRLELLPDPQAFKVFAGLVLLYIGFRLVYDTFFKKTNTQQQNSEDKFHQLVKSFKDKNKNLPRTEIKKFSLKTLVYTFYGEEFIVPVIPITILSFVVGIVGGVYGIGGGAIMAPFFVAFFRLPVYTVAGPALMGTFLTSIIAVLFFMFLSNFYPATSVSPDWLLGLLFGIGGAAGMYCGAVLQKYIPAKFIKTILSFALVFIAVKYISEIF